MEKRPKSGYGYIYKYTSPSGFSYIGQTTRSLAARAGHNGKNYQGCDYFYRAIQKYGFENFDVEVLAEAKIEDLDNLEKKYIQIFNSLAPNGYNLSEGGQNVGAPRQLKKIYQYSSEDGKLMKVWDSILDVAEAYDTIPQTFESCLLNYTFTQYNYCWSYLEMDKFPIHERIVNQTPKKVKMYSLSGELLQEFDSISEAARYIGKERSPIKKCCRHELHQAYGYKWECSEVLAEKRYNNTAKPIQQIDRNTGEIIQVFPSISAAARSLGKETSLIRKVLDREKNTAYGYKWKTAQGSTTTDL